MGIEFYCGLFGLFAIPFIAWLMSHNRSKVMWKVVIGGMSIQLVLGVLVLLTKPGQLIFFSALMSVLYYTGFMQKIVEFVAWIIMRVLGTSGAETLSVSANIFVGQTEAPLVIRPFVKDMTMSELNTVMVGGFATVAGGVMAAYVGMLHPYFPAIAGHLITASILSAPAAIVMSKLSFPEEEEPVTRGAVEVDIEEKDQNLLDAAASGAAAGLKLALNVGAMLLAFIALVYMGNFAIGWGGSQLYRLISETTGWNAFFGGAVFGFVILSFYIARWRWKGSRTKYWITGLLLVLCLPAAAYYILPDLLSVRFGLPGYGVWAVIGIVGGFLLGAGVTFRWFRKLKSLWLQSLAIILGGGATLGLITFLLGGSGSQWGAAALLFGIFGLVGATVVYWRNPSRATVIKALAIVSIAAFIGALITAVFNLNMLATLENLTLQKLLGFLFSGLALLVGVPWSDLVSVGQLIGEKVAINEFVAFMTFKNMASQGILSARSLVIASYALCGFANLSSIAIQIGGIGGIAPKRTKDLAKLGFRAMTAGVLASAQTAAVAGVMFGIAEQIGIKLVTLG
jgi:nucleoside permease NupC